MLARHLLKLCCLLPLICTVSTNIARAEGKRHPLDRVIRIVSKCLADVEKVPGYETTMTKKELVDGTVVVQQMKMKFRRDPFSVYFYFTGDNEGREVIYVEGKNNGKMIAHEGGFAGLIGTLRLAPTDSLAMGENRHPITEAGIEKMLKNTLADLEQATKFSETEVKYYKDARVGKMKCNVIEVSHPRPRQQFPMKMMRLYIDRETGFAVRMQKFAFPAQQGAEPPLVEDYRYTDLRTDVKLMDRDFDENNPKYNF